MKSFLLSVNPWIALLLSFILFIMAGLTIPVISSREMERTYLAESSRPGISSERKQRIEAEGKESVASTKSSEGAGLLFFVLSVAGFAASFGSTCCRLIWGKPKEDSAGLPDKTIDR